MNPEQGKLRHAISQLLRTLQDLMAVPVIAGAINGFQNRECIFFNKQAQPPDQYIDALIAFNPIFERRPDQISNPDIELYGFTLWSYSDGVPYILN
jgi:hypothetical protein